MNLDEELVLTNLVLVQGEEIVRALDEQIEELQKRPTEADVAEIGELLLWMIEMQKKNVEVVKRLRQRQSHLHDRV